MDNLKSLATPDEFIQHYYKQLKSDLDVDDININRLGFLGFFFDLLGNTQYDIKNYYNTLFAEAFPITASNNSNLLYHSDVHGYVPAFATPSVIQGTFKFDFTSFPIIPTNVKKREIDISDNLSLLISELEYILDANYKLVFDRVMTDLGLPTNTFRINCEIKSNDGFEIIPLLPSNSEIKIVDLKQYSVSEENVKLPNYVFGIHYVYTIELKDFIYILEIEVKEKDSDAYEKYELRANKSFSIPDEKVIFFKISPRNELILEFGSGINGKYIPYSDIKIKLKTTKGKIGNISTNVSTPRGIFKSIDFDYNDNIILTNTVSFTPSAIEANISGSYDGKDAEIEEVLRTNLIKYIQSRNNLMSELDFENNLKSYFDVCEILFKKTEVVDNIIYCYIPLYDRLLNPIYTLTTSVLLSDFERRQFYNNVTNDKLVYEPEFTINGKIFISPFLYIYNKLLNMYYGFFVIENNVVNFSEKLNIGTNTQTISIFMEIEFLGAKTRLWVKSYSDIDKYSFTISSQMLTFNNNNMISNGNSFYIDYNNGLIDKDSNITITLYNIYNVAIIDYKFYGVRSVYNFSEIIKLKPIPLSNTHYIANLPLIEKETYVSEKKYYQTKILTNIQKLTISQNRMLSDEVQLRFLNTYYLDKLFLKDLIIQYSMDNTNDLPIQDYYFPFKLELTIDFAKDKLLYNNKNAVDEADGIVENISKFLLEQQTGLNITFYKSKIIDIIHNNSLVKHATVKLKDNKNIEIPNYNIENNNNKIFIEKLNKEYYLHYSPIYYWFDLNNITYTLKAYD